MVVEIVITQDEWDDLVSTMWGDVEAAAEHVRDLMLNQPRDQRYLVATAATSKHRPATVVRSPLHASYQGLASNGPIA